MAFCLILITSRVTDQLHCCKSYHTTDCTLHTGVTFIRMYRLIFTIQMYQIKVVPLRLKTVNTDIEIWKKERNVYTFPICAKPSVIFFTLYDSKISVEISLTFLKGQILRRNDFKWCNMSRPILERGMSCLYQNTPEGQRFNFRERISHI
jgi:hypothetical protein